MKADTATIKEAIDSKQIKQRRHKKVSKGSNAYENCISKASRVTNVVTVLFVVRVITLARDCRKHRQQGNQGWPNQRDAV